MYQQPASRSRSGHRFDVLTTTEHLPRAQHGRPHIPIPCPLLSLGKGSCSSSSQQSSAQGQVVPFFTSWSSAAHQDREVLAEPERCAFYQRSQDEPVAACMLPAGTRRPAGTSL